MGPGGWVELGFLGTRLGRAGEPVREVVELLRTGLDCMVGRDAGRGFSWAAFLTEEGLDGAGGLSDSWMEQDEGSGFSRQSWLKDVSEIGKEFRSCEMKPLDVLICSRSRKSSEKTADRAEI